MAAVASLPIIIVAVYILAIITDEFFVVSLDEVSKRLALPSNVAGASLMAVGSSAPELFIALIAVYQGGSHSDVGIGTIVGSAVFNILVITGAAAVISGGMKMVRGAVERDIVFYLGSIFLLLFVFWDGEIIRNEALLMLAAYVGYLLLLWFWSQTNPEDSQPGHPDDPQEKKEAESFFGRLNETLAKILNLVFRDAKKYYLWAMLLSIVAIIGLSWILVENAVILADALNLPPVIVSLTLLAAGTSAPDLIASVGVARDGRGAMAVANAVGSNIFDILIGLGLPWIIMIVFMFDKLEEYQEHGRKVVLVGTDGLVVSIFLLSATTILLYQFLYTERTLTRREGWGLLGTYVLYVIYVVATSG